MLAGGQRLDRPPPIAPRAGGSTMRRTMELRAAEASPGTRGVDARVAHPARVYDCWLGGKDNFEADRIAAAETVAAYPAILSSARANRAFLVRAVSYLTSVFGIRQFLDIGSGLPAAPNTHEV